MTDADKLCCTYGPSVKREWTSIMYEEGWHDVIYSVIAVGLYSDEKECTGACIAMSASFWLYDQRHRTSCVGSWNCNVALLCWVCLCLLPLYRSSQIYDPVQSHLPYLHANVHHVMASPCSVIHCDAYATRSLIWWAAATGPQIIHSIHGSVTYIGWSAGWVGVSRGMLLCDHSLHPLCFGPRSRFITLCICSFRELPTCGWSDLN